MVMPPASLILSRVGRISCAAAGPAATRRARIARTARTDLIDMVVVPRRTRPTKGSMARVPDRGRPRYETFVPWIGPSEGRNIPAHGEQRGLPPVRGRVLLAALLA